MCHLPTLPRHLSHMFTLNLTASHYHTYSHTVCMFMELNQDFYNSRLDVIFYCIIRMTHWTADDIACFIYPLNLVIYHIYPPQSSRHVTIIYHYMYLQNHGTEPKAFYNSRLDIIVYYRVCHPPTKPRQLSHISAPIFTASHYYTSSYAYAYSWH